MKLSHLVILGGLLLHMACKKDLDLNGGTPDFEVVSTTGTFKRGEPVVFKFAGNADNISFYSGEPQKDYAFRSGRTEAATGGLLAFTSAVTGGAQAGQFSVLASSDFSGNYTDLTAVKAATWTDITARFKLGSTATFAASGNKDVTDLLAAGKPLYVAFRYITQPQQQNGAARTWMVQGYAFQGITALGNLTGADMFTGAFRLVTSNPATAPARSAVSTSRLTLLANEFTADNDPLTENWAISAPVTWEQLNLGPDRPVGIKGGTAARLESYAHTYANPGTYKATFVASNVNIDQRSEVVREVTVTVQ
ncbi:DUF5017 domain-containing protein [Chitinophaga alhagiae]|uniref:DUF5017 domain-containing protein n=1 Tax=Chitinophaga alhagiae TaxID=2203219 RepID=UPI000E5AD1DB|nr:DUF5017 domain-containing protein [Chitinophaga alhagiae]